MYLCMYLVQCIPKEFLYSQCHRSFRKTKLILYETLIFSMLIYDAEAWPILSTVRVFERKDRRKFFSPVWVGDEFRIRINSELYELRNDIYFVPCTNIQRLRWFFHIVQVNEDAPARRVFDSGIYRSRQRGRPCLRWKNHTALSSIDVTNWRRCTRSISVWKDMLRQSEIR